MPARRSTAGTSSQPPGVEWGLSGEAESPSQPIFRLLIQIKAGPEAMGAVSVRTTQEHAMTHTPHELADEFPEFAAKLHELKLADPHFARLAVEYHDLNRAIHRAETGVEPVSEPHEGELRRKRMELKDAIARRLRAA
jgi:uncharacterized protein